ncbi:MAG: MarR family winged helix-turn-helix transcriptional regulator [Pseudomonadota bacterium]
MTPAKPQTNPSTVEQAPSFPCLCAAIRRAGRIATRQYDAYLKPSGLKITQFSMLANIARNPEITVTRLADLLLMDQTTVTRNLVVLEKAGWVGLEPGESDRRLKRVTITAAGQAKLDRARPYWLEAQAAMEATLGRAGIADLLASFQKLLE